jgi:hypothetical protein
LVAVEKLAGARVDAITTETIGASIAARKDAGMQISSTASSDRSPGRFTWRRNGAGREGVFDRADGPRRKSSSNEYLNAEEEALYFTGAKSEAMHQHMDPSLLSNVATILLDCGLRPEGCLRLRTENVDGKIEVQ